MHAGDIGFQVRGDTESRFAAQMLIGAACDIVRRADVPVVGDLCGAPATRVADEIVTAAGDVGADRIVGGSRGSGPLTEAFLGRVATQVVHRAHCPVLVARTPAVTA